MTHSIARAAQRRFLICTLTLAALCGSLVAEASDALAISGTPSQGVSVGQAYSFTPTVSDPSKGKLSFIIVNRPGWATFSATTGTLSGTPTAAWAGNQENDILITVSDGSVSASLPEFHIKVGTTTTGGGGGGGGGSGSLAISGTPSQGATVGTSYTFTPTVSDPSKASESFTIVNRPGWATFSATTGTLTGTPTAAWAGNQENDILITVSAGGASASLPEFHIKVSAASSGGGSDVPVISGTPSTSVVAGSAYSFQPTAKDPDGKTLSFSVQNKPTWATFSIASGLLDGTPTTAQTGAYDDIVISASNGTSTSALPAFNVSVTKAPTSTTGSATIDWVAPTKNTNGSALTDLAGFRIYYGTSPSSLTKVVQVASSTQTSFTIGGLAAGTWYFGGVAYTTTGTQSGMSSVVSTSIP
jgi:hypothetical protein